MDDPIIITALALAWFCFFDKPKAIWKLSFIDAPPQEATLPPLEAPIFVKPGLAVGRSRATAMETGQPRKRVVQLTRPKAEPPNPFSRN